jgi:hypothetical protein
MMAQHKRPARAESPQPLAVAASTIRSRTWRPAAAALLLGGLLLVGCQKDKQEAAATDAENASLDIHEVFNGKVENGVAYDKATLEPGDHEAVVVPKEAKVETGGQGIEIYMAKRLSYAGHPREFMSIREERKKMGCASRTETKKLVIGTFGEWDSNIEGGAEMMLLIRVPATVRVERRKGLSGPIDMRPERSEKPPRPLITPGADGWKAIPETPDPKHTAKSAEKP